MKIAITRTDIVHIEPTRGSPLEHETPARQLAGFRAAFTKTIFDETTGLAFETSDGDWEYAYLDHVSVQVGFVPADPPAPPDEEP